MSRTAELVSTGRELLSGRVLNTHAQMLARYLAGVGVELVRDTTVSDDVAAIAEAFKGALSRTPLVFVTGGLGPTPDDVTRDAVARALGTTVVCDPDALAFVKQRYAQRRRTFNPASARQALVVQGAAVLPNPVGIAPGERLQVDDRVVFVLPGPPAEFRAVMAEHVLPWLATWLPSTAARPERVFLLCGLGESDVVTRMQEAGFPPAGLDVAFCARPGQLELRLLPSPGAPDAPALLESAAGRLRALLGNAIYAEEAVSLEEMIGRLLTERGLSVAVAESCSGGLLGHRITAVPGSSAYFLGGVIAYADAVKIQRLNVSAEALRREGAVSRAVAQQMAEGVRKALAADIGLGVTGIAGPTGATDAKPVGLVFVALADDEGVLVHENRFSGDRDEVKYRATQAALDMLRRRLIERAGPAAAGGE
ncbi:MAG: competence/damage-inducible protein A [Kiritimatiellae bacterium]|nr:competence/damage-inducible protein A [Kiritimatiellia bacterium]